MKKLLAIALLSVAPLYGVTTVVKRTTGTQWVIGTLNGSELVFTDATTNDASTLMHGFLQKLPGGTTTFLRADGTFAVPPGTGATGTGTLNTIPKVTNATGPVYGDSALSDDGTTVTTSRPFKDTANGALSAPGSSYIGTWITGGSATTTKPYLLIEPTGTTSTAWSTNGTGFGINAATGFTGNLIDAQLAGTSKFSVSYAGVVALPTFGVASFNGDTGVSRCASIADCVAIGGGSTGDGSGLLEFRRGTQAQTTNTTMGTSDNNWTWTNTGASGTVTLTLKDDALVGSFYTFCSTVAQDLVIQPNTGETLYDGGTSYSSVKVNGAVNCVTIQSVVGGSGGKWAVVSKNGTVTDTP